MGKKLVIGLVNFVPAVAYHFCLALPAAFTQPGDHFLAEVCTEGGGANLVLRMTASQIKRRTLVSHPVVPSHQKFQLKWDFAAQV